MRARIEATNSAIKRRTGIGKLRVRGRPGVFNTILLKIAGWNILQAPRSTKAREDVRKQAAWSSEDTISSMIEFCRWRLTTQTYLSALSLIPHERQEWD